MKKLVLFVTVLILWTGIVEGQESRRAKRKAREKAKMEEILQLVNSRHFQFQAQSAHPMGGGVIQLTSEYTLDIQNEKVTAFLPYFGVAYTAEIGNGEGGIKFSETARSSEWKSSKKGYEILLEVKAPKDLFILNLSVSALGYANLSVSCNNRQPINFQGIVQAVPERK
jgi:hypothetical protein